MDEQDTSRFDDLLEPLRSLGWTAAIEDDGALHLSHPLQDMVLSADAPEQMRRMLSAWFPPESAIMEALRQAPDHAEDLAVVGDHQGVPSVLVESAASKLRLGGDGRQGLRR